MVDYRKLNAITIKEPFPFPVLEEQLQQLNGSEIFSQIDLANGYHQIKVRDQDTHKTSFAILGNQYEFIRMPFGLTNAPRTFQKSMKRMFDDLDYVKVFLDDLLIHSANDEQHFLHLKTVMDRLLDNNIKINFEKSTFCKREVTYLGRIISKEGIRADLSRFKKHEEEILVTPKNKKGLQRILGIINWYRSFLPKLSIKIHNITSKLTNKKELVWDYDDEIIIKQILEEIKKNIRLNHPNLNKPFRLYTDAAHQGISAILMQDIGIVGVFSAKLNKSELNYSIVEKECLAIIKGILYFRNLIYNSEIEIYTDSKNVTFVKEINSSRWQKWKLILEEFNYKIYHVVSAQNLIADFYSKNCSIKIPKLPNNMLIDLLKEIQRKAKITNEKIISLNLRSKTLKDDKDNPTELLVHKNEKIFIPNNEQEETIKLLHLLFKHPGINKLYNTIHRFIRFNNLKSIIRKESNKCIGCQRNKHRHEKIGKLTGFIYAKEPRQKVCTDILGPIIDPKLTNNRRKYLLTITDVFSRYTKVYVLTDINSGTIIKKFKLFFRDEFIPKEIISDRGRQYTSKEFKNLCQKKLIKLNLRISGLPTSNGIAERLNSTINNLLRIYKNELSLRQIAENCEFTINCTFHKGIKTTPLTIQKGINILGQRETVDIEEISKLQLQQKKETLNKANLNRKEPSTISTGGKIMIRNQSQQKLANLWDGPFEVLELSRDQTRMKVICNGKHKWVHIRQVRPWRE